METFIISVGIQCLLVLLALLALKKNLHLFEKMKAANTIETASQQNMKVRRKEFEQMASAISRCGLVVLLFKNFSFLNPLCNSVPNRSQLLLLTYSTISLYLYYVDFWFPSFVLGSLLTSVVIIYQLIEAKKVDEYTGSALVQVQEKSLYRWEIMSCGVGLVTVGICFVLISQLYNDGSSGDWTTLSRLALALLVDSLVVKLTLFFLGALFCGNGLLLVSILQIKEMKGNKVRNQFYKTSQSEANVNEAINIPKESYFIYEQPDFPLPKYKLQPNNELQGQHLHYENENHNSIEKKSLEQCGLEKEQKILIKSIGKQRKYSGGEPEITKFTALKDKSQPSTKQTEQVKGGLTRSTFFGQKENGGSVQGKKKSSRSKNISEIESYRIIKIYGDKTNKSQLQRGLKYRKSQGESFKQSIGTRSTDHKSRNRPIVHQTWNGTLPEKIQIRPFFGPQTETH